MPKPRSSTHPTMKELVRQQREALYSSGHRNLHMTLPLDVIDQIDLLKAQHGLRSRDAVVGRIIRKSLLTLGPEAFLQRPSSPIAPVRRISPIVAGELADYVRLIQLRFRGMAYGPVFEMIFAEVGRDLSCPPLRAD